MPIENIKPKNQWEVKDDNIRMGQAYNISHEEMERLTNLRNIEENTEEYNKLIMKKARLHYQNLKVLQSEL
jgi:hypothetical protein